MENETDRNGQKNRAFFEIIHALNDLDRYRGGLFDCGELGFCRVWWHRRSWQCEWYEAETLQSLQSSGS